MAHAQAFPKALRLRKRREFLKLQEGHSSVQVSAACLLALAQPNGTNSARLGLTVSAKVGKAVLRNRIRRQLRQWFRTHIEELPKGIDLVLIARRQAATASSDELAASFAAISQQLRRRFS
jgi:ribonuclease P protein component